MGFLITDRPQSFVDDIADLFKFETAMAHVQVSGVAGHRG
jgi:hypothetical protein